MKRRPCLCVISGLFGQVVSVTSSTSLVSFMTGFFSLSFLFGDGSFANLILTHSALKGFELLMQSYYKRSQVLSEEASRLISLRYHQLPHCCSFYSATLQFARSRTSASHSRFQRPFIGELSLRRRPSPSVLSLIASVLTMFPHVYSAGDVVHCPEHWWR